MGFHEFYRSYGFGLFLTDFGPFFHPFFHPRTELFIGRRTPGFALLAYALSIHARRPCIGISSRSSPGSPPRRESSSGSGMHSRRSRTSGLVSVPFIPPC